MLTEEQYKERCAEILRNGITFSGQVGDYVIHGALEELWKLHTEQNLNIASVMESLPPADEMTVFYQCVNCGKDTDEKQWIGNCSRECLKQWLDNHKMNSGGNAP